MQQQVYVPNTFSFSDWLFIPLHTNNLFRHAIRRERERKSLGELFFYTISFFCTISIPATDTDLNFLLSETNRTTFLEQRFLNFNTSFAIFVTENLGLEELIFTFFSLLRSVVPEETGCLRP